MKCPNCNHTSTTALFKCSACGEAYDRASLETLEHLEYLLAWLDDRQQAADLKPEAHEALRSQALKQLTAARAALGLPKAAPAVPAVAQAPAPQPAAPRPAEQVARALGLVETTLDKIPGWRDTGLISRASASRLTSHLRARVQALQVELAGRTVIVPPPSKMQMLEFALGSLAHWAKDGHIVERDVETFRGYLKNQQSALLHPGPAPKPAPPPVPLAIVPGPAPTPAVAPAVVRSPEDIARELALVEAALKQIPSWEASMIGTKSVNNSPYAVLGKLGG